MSRFKYSQATWRCAGPIFSNGYCRRLIQRRGRSQTFANITFVAVDIIVGKRALSAGPSPFVRSPHSRQRIVFLQQRHAKKIISFNACDLCWSSNPTLAHAAERQSGSFSFGHWWCFDFHRNGPFLFRARSCQCTYIRCCLCFLHECH